MATRRERLENLRKRERLEQLRALEAQQAARQAEAERIPASEPTAADQAVGALENVASMVTGAIAQPISGFAAIGQGLNPFAEPGASGEAIERVQEALTFQPRTQAGREQQQAIAEFLSPVTKSLSEFERKLASSTLEATGSPVLAGIVQTLPAAAIEILGVKGAGRLATPSTPSTRLIKNTLVEAAPDIEKIKNASRAIFNELDNSGVAINQNALKRLERNIDDVVARSGIDSRVTPEAAGAVDAIKESIESGLPVTTREMDTLRTVARNAVSTTDANKARVALSLVDEIDDFLDNIKSADIQKGATVNASQVGKSYRAARKLWGRAKRSEMLQDAIEMGASRKAGVEKGIRNELNNLLNRKKSRKFLTPDDVRAIRKVTDGDFRQNFASLIGGMGLKLENSPSMFGSLISGGGLGAIASTVPGLGGTVAPIAVGAITAGTISKELAKRMTRNRASFVDSVVRAGNDGKKIVESYLKAVPKRQRSVSDLSDLLIDPNIDLNALSTIANETVKDAIKAAQFKREMLQASTALGVGALISEDADDNDESN